MEGGLLATWAARSAAERAACLQICDPEVVQLIDANMRMLWAAEIQAWQFGMQGPSHPVQHSQLPLLSTIQFDGAMQGATADPQNVVKRVKWPQEVSDDPLVVISALQASGLLGASRHGVSEKRLPRKQWAQLFHPPANVWVDFEKQLARLVEQLLMELRQVTAPSIDAGAVAEEGGDADADAEDAGEEKPALRARAAKRQRQRERRRMGKALQRAANDLEADDTEPAVAAADGAAAGISGGTGHVANKAAKQEAGVQEGAVPKHVPAPQRDAEALAENGSFKVAAEDNVEASKECDARLSKPSTTAASTQPVALVPTEGAAPANASAASPNAAPDSSPSRPLATTPPPPTARPAAEPKAVPAAQRRTERLPEPVMEPLSSGSGSGDGDDTAASAKSGSIAPSAGVGRGRPMGSQFPSFGLPGRGMGVGRGKALAPPPGLQMLNFNNSQKSPGLTLSRPWIPGPPILEVSGETLEDDEDSHLDDMAFPAWQGMPPELEPSIGAMSAGDFFVTAERTPSLWSKASCIGTPTEDWGMTPSIVSEPPSPALVSQFGAPEGVFNAGLNMAGPLANPLFPGMDMALPPSAVPHNQFTQPVIPMYVTVPLAVAHCCPHCGKHFATPPGVDGPGNALPPNMGPVLSQAADAGGGAEAAVG